MKGFFLINKWNKFEESSFYFKEKWHLYLKLSNSYIFKLKKFMLGKPRRKKQVLTNLCIAVGCVLPAMVARGASVLTGVSVLFKCLSQWSLSRGGGRSLWTEWHTYVKTLPCLKLRLCAVRKMLNFTHCSFKHFRYVVRSMLAYV